MMPEVCKHGHPPCVHGGCRSHCDECIRAVYERMCNPGEFPLGITLTDGDPEIERARALRAGEIGRAKSALRMRKGAP